VQNQKCKQSLSTLFLFCCCVWSQKTRKKSYRSYFFGKISIWNNERLTTQQKQQGQRGNLFLSKMSINLLAIVFSFNFNVPVNVTPKLLRFHAAAKKSRLLTYAKWLFKKKLFILVMYVMLKCDKLRNITNYIINYIIVMCVLHIQGQFNICCLFRFCNHPDRPCHPAAPQNVAMLHLCRLRYFNVTLRATKICHQPITCMGNNKLLCLI